MKDCCQKREYTFTFDNVSVSHGCDTCGHGSETKIDVNRYCKYCKAQKGYVTIDTIQEIESLNDLFEKESY